MPWLLKHWIDTVTQPQLLFGFDPATGYRGLAGGRRAAVVYASSVYADGLSPAFGRDFHRAYLEDWLRSAYRDWLARIAKPEPQPERRRIAGGASAA